MGAGCVRQRIKIVEASGNRVNTCRAKLVGARGIACEPGNRMTTGAERFCCCASDLAGAADDDNLTCTLLPSALRSTRHHSSRPSPKLISHALRAGKMGYRTEQN